MLGLDLGARRIGVAVSNRGGTLASPATVLQRGDDAATDHRRIAELVEEHGASRVVVGLPLSLDGTAGPAARATLEEVSELAEVLSVPVEVSDERFTTVSAARALREAGVRGKESRQKVDAAAAAVLLQDWLDRRHTANCAGRPSTSKDRL